MLNAKFLMASVIALCSCAVQAQGQGTDWKNYMASGRPFLVVLDVPFEAPGVSKPLGDIKVGNTYNVCYSRDNGAFVATGYHIGRGRVETLTSPKIELRQHVIGIWGRQFRFCADGSVIDFQYGKVGTLKTSIKPSILERIQRGCTFRVTFDLCNNEDTNPCKPEPMGNLKAGESYFGSYRASDHSFTVSGYHEGQDDWVKLTYSNGNINAYTISLWGRLYQFDEFGYVYDPDLGLVGHILVPRIPWTE